MKGSLVTDAQIPYLPGLHPLQKLGLLRAGVCVGVLTQVVSQLWRSQVAAVCLLHMVQRHGY